MQHHAKITWFVSISSLDLEAIWLVLCATDSDKHPAEAQPDPPSPPYGFISEISPVLYLFHSKQLTHLPGMLRARTPSVRWFSAGWAYSTWSHLGDSWHPGLPMAVNPQKKPSKTVAWGTTMQGFPAALGNLLWCPLCPIWAGFLDNTQASPTHTERLDLRLCLH